MLGKRLSQHGPIYIIIILLSSYIDDIYSLPTCLDHYSIKKLFVSEYYYKQIQILGNDLVSNNRKDRGFEPRSASPPSYSGS